MFCKNIEYKKSYAKFNDAAMVNNIFNFEVP